MDDTAQHLADLAADLAAVNGIPVEEAERALMRALNSMAEPVEVRGPRPASPAA